MKPSGVAIDVNGNVWVKDNRSDTIISPKGRLDRDAAHGPQLPGRNHNDATGRRGESCDFSPAPRDAPRERNTGGGRRIRPSVTRWGQHFEPPRSSVQGRAHLEARQRRLREARQEIVVGVRCEAELVVPRARMRRIVNEPDRAIRLGERARRNSPRVGPTPSRRPAPAASSSPPSRRNRPSSRP
jgi:hypothetical protein